MKNASDDIFDEIFSFIKKIPREPKKVYAVALILIVLFPPINSVRSSGAHRFQGWDFITALGGRYQININYLIIEFVLITVIYYLFRNKDK
tara:strand:+ start:280 stop:552 length:273 start_codon:yes stop_codon:yes gene_type:complete